MEFFLRRLSPVPRTTPPPWLPPLFLLLSSVSGTRTSKGRDTWHWMDLKKVGNLLTSGRIHSPGSTFIHYTGHRTDSILFLDLWDFPSDTHSISSLNSCFTFPSMDRHDHGLRPTLDRFLTSGVFTSPVSPTWTFLPTTSTGTHKCWHTGNYPTDELCLILVLHRFPGSGYNYCSNDELVSRLNF